MTISKITSNKKQYIELLLLADEQEDMIDRYLERGEMFVMYSKEQEAICLAVVTDEENGICELKNMAVDPRFQRKGYGKKMMDFLCKHYGNMFHTMTVGTGDSINTVSFYQSCGFEYSHTVPDFFTLHYDHPIIEEGKTLKDMIYFRKEIITIAT